MSRLLGVETRRLAARGLARSFALAAVLAILAAAVAVFLASHHADPASLARARTARAQAIDRCVHDAFRPPLDQVAASDRREFCANEAIPAGPYTFELRGLTEILKGTGLKGSSLPLVLVGLLLGASFLGADQTHKTITTQLLWEPRRLRLLAAKLLAGAAGVTLAAMLVQAALAAALLPAALARGTTSGADAAWLHTLAGVALRVAVVAGLAAVAGAALATIGRGTAAALAAVAVYATAEGFARGFENPVVQRWLLGENAALFIFGEPARAAATGRSVPAAGVLLAAVTAGLLLAAAWLFRHRDLS